MENNCIKDIVVEAIKKEKQEITEKYDSDIKKISEESNFVKIYYIIVKSLDNKVQARELGVKFLKENLINDFFKEAVISATPNYIIFKKELKNSCLEIKFPIYLSKTVHINFSNKENYPCYYPKISKDLIKLADLTETWLNKKSFKNFKILADFNWQRSGKGIIEQISKYINTYKKCNQKLLQKIRNDQEENEKAKADYEKDLNKYLKNEEEVEIIIKSLFDTDLNKFKAEDWKIDLEGFSKNEDKYTLMFRKNLL